MNKYLFKRALWPMAVGLLALLSPVPMQAEENVNMLYFEGGTGNDFFSYRFFLVSAPEWTPSEEMHTIEYRGTRFEIPNSPELRVSLFYDKEEGVEDAGGAGTEIIIKDEKIVIRHAYGMMPVTVFDTSGSIIISESTEEADEFEIDLSTLSPGIYLLSAGKQTFKFIRK